MNIIEKTFSGKTVIICGGSKGIGKAVAIQLAKNGCNVLIIARNKEILEKAAIEVSKSKLNNQQFVESFDCDTTDFDKLKIFFDDFVANKGVPDFLINNVGYAKPLYIEQHTISDFKNNMEVNYFGQLYPTLALLPHFTKAKKGHIANTSSALGFMGIMGYASYCPSKYAIVGLSEVMRHELKPYNINVSVLYPPDTSTEGFEEENKTKPEECKIISEGGGLLSAEKVADVFIKGIIKKTFDILPGETSFMKFMFRIAPNLVRGIIDGKFKKARKKLGK